MKKLLINTTYDQSIRQDGLYYSLSDLYRCTTLNDNYSPWEWAQREGRTRDISRRGWFSKKCWAKSSVLIEYAHYLTPVLYRDVIKALGIDDAEELIEAVGIKLASRLNPDGVKEHLAAVSRSREPVKVDLPKPEVLLRDRSTGRIVPPRRPARSVTRSRSMGPSVTHHRSEPDYLTQAMVMNAVMDDTPTRSHSSHSRSDDTCFTPSHSSHDHSSSSSSWSGDSGGSYDSGSSGGCD